MFSSTHINGDVIYSWLCSLPSGCGLTTIVNSIYNKVVIRMAYVTCMGRNYKSLDTFNDNVNEMVYGDDNIINVSIKVQDLFNMTSIRSAVNEIGMDYTDETKSADCVTVFRSIYDVTFLKRHFVYDYHLDQVISPLEWETVRQMMNYVKMNVDQTSVVQSAFKSFIMEVSLHEKEKFDDVVAKFEEPMRKHFNFSLFTKDVFLQRDITLKQDIRY